MSYSDATPVKLVDNFHSISRFGYIGDLLKVNLWNGDTWTARSYVEGVAVNVGIVLGMGILLFFIALFTYFAVCCCRCCRVCKKRESQDGELVSLTLAQNRLKLAVFLSVLFSWRRCLRKLTFLCLVSAAWKALRCSVIGGVIFTLILLAMSIAAAVQTSRIVKEVLVLLCFSLFLDFDRVPLLV
jgi:integral membrane sensor domain MASE1